MGGWKEQVDVKQVILGAPYWFLLRGAACGVLQELVVASLSVPVTGSRYGHPVPVTANTRRGPLCWQRLEKAFGQLVEAGVRV